MLSQMLYCKYSILQADDLFLSFTGLQMERTPG